MRLLLCAGMLPPSFVEYALRTGADGVMIASCRHGGCEYRLGRALDDRATATRQREPQIARQGPGERLAAVLYHPTTRRYPLPSPISGFVCAASPLPTTRFNLTFGEPPTMLKPAAAIAGQVVLYGAFAAFIGYFATDPKFRQIPDDVAVIKVSFSHLGDRECRKRTRKNSPSCHRTCARPMDCPRERSDIKVEIDIDDKNVITHTLHPTGLWGWHLDDVPTPRIKAGHHKIAARMRDNVKQEGWKYVKEETDRSEAGAESRDRLPPRPRRPLLGKPFQTHTPSIPTERKRQWSSYCKPFCAGVSCASKTCSTSPSATS